MDLMPGGFGVSSPAMSVQERILTGDTPTGNLHIGHWVGSVKRRVELQDQHDCFFLIAKIIQ